MNAKEEEECLLSENSKSEKDTGGKAVALGAWWKRIWKKEGEQIAIKLESKEALPASPGR